VWGAGERRNAHTLKGTSPYFKIWKKEKDVFRDTYVQEIQRPYFETPAFKYGVPYTLHPIPYTLFIVSARALFLFS
jgi:hypothetical protein